MFFICVFAVPGRLGNISAGAETSGGPARQENLVPETYVSSKKRKRGRPRKVVRFRPVTGDRFVVYEEEAEEEIIDGRMMLGKRNPLQGEEREFQDQEEEGEPEEVEE